MSNAAGISGRGRARRRSVPGQRARARRGFTIVELVVAILILTVGVLSLAGTARYMVKQMASAQYQTLAAQIAQSRFDSLASVNCLTLAPQGGASSGTTTTRGITERWSVKDGNDVMNLVDSITYKGRTKALEYKSVIPCRDF